ncbi:MAG: long-chain-fatty-acid--CoA ligase [Burkholderiaceae bacterium]|nr:long-chain-fatty-acid--CoA ligase [Burkholderiaceae bacterium]
MQIGRLLAPQAGRQFSLEQTLTRVVRLHGDSIATVDRGHRQTWSAYGERVMRLAGALQALGLADGERVAILSNNSHRYLEIYHAVPWAGGIFAPLNFRLAAPEQAAILADCGARILIADDDHLERAGQLLRDASGLQRIHAGDGPAPAGWLSYEHLIDQAEPAQDACRAGDDVAALFYTSGSTGRPKGVMHTHANLVASAIAYAAAIGLDEGTVALVSSPMFHVGAAGLAVPAMVSGGRVVVLPRFEPAQVLRLIEQERATVTSVVPTMLRMLVDHPNAASHDLSSLRTLLYGAAPMPEALVSQAREHFTRTEFTHCYGMTESTASVSVLPSRYVMPSHRHLDKWRSAGRAILGTDLAIVDAQDQVLPPGEVGEIVVRGPLVMAGYWNQPELTAQTLRHGWLHTGDLGSMDADGFVTIVDRLKDMIITGGENVYSAEVEAAVYSHPGVAQCAVIGIPDPRWGEAVHAIVSASPGASLSAASIIAHCRGRIAAYKCPRSVDVREAALPLSGANKIDKPTLRAPFWAGHASRLV